MRAHLPALALAGACVIASILFPAWLALACHRPDLAEGVCIAFALGTLVVAGAIGVAHLVSRPAPQQAGGAVVYLFRTEWCGRCQSLQRADQYGRIVAHHDPKSGAPCGPRVIA